MLGETNELRNRNMHISGLLADKPEKIGHSDIKSDIERPKSDIEMWVSNFGLSSLHEKYLLKIASAHSETAFIGRRDIMKVTDLKESRASEIIKALLAAGAIEPVQGHGKGKYRLTHK